MNKIFYMMSLSGEVRFWFELNVKWYLYIFYHYQSKLIMLDSLWCRSPPPPPPPLPNTRFYWNLTVFQDQSCQQMDRPALYMFTSCTLCTKNEKQCQGSTFCSNISNTHTQNYAFYLFSFVLLCWLLWYWVIMIFHVQSVSGIFVYICHSKNFC
jgi:hypothetical protein